MTTRSAVAGTASEEAGLESASSSPARAIPGSLYGLLALMVFVWSINFVVAKNALHQFPPLLLGLLRFTIGGLVILPVYLWKREPAAAASAKFPWKMLAIGVIGVGLNQLVFLQGLVRTSVAHSAILIAMTPVMVLLLSAWVGHERLTRAKLIGLAVAITGVLTLQGRTLLGGHGSVLGDLCVLLADVTFALFTVAGKEIRGRYTPLTLNTWAYAGSAAVFAPLTLWQAARFDFSAVNAMGWVSLAWIGTFPSVVAYLIFYHALQYLPASRVSKLAYLQPFLATLFAVPLLGEKVTTSLVIGGALVLAGVFWAERK